MAVSDCNASLSAVCGHRGTTALPTVLELAGLRKQHEEYPILFQKFG